MRAASPSVTCYPTPGKVKATRICEWFAEGVRAAGDTAQLMNGTPTWLGDGAAVFYGVTAPTEHLWHQARAEKRDWYYIDNSYFDATRGTHYRITKNAVQFEGEPLLPSNGKRFAELGIEVHARRAGGDHIVVCLQSPQFMKIVAGVSADAWWSSIHPALKATGRQIRIRGWSGNKKQQMDTLADDLREAWALVSYSSAAAVAALLAGVPAYCSGPSAIGELCSPSIGAGWWNAGQVRQRMNVLADNQWSIAEIRDGTAWKALNA